MTKTVRMSKEDLEKTGGPTLADVHPEEVENWKALGWQVVVESKNQGSENEGGEIEENNQEEEKAISKRKYRKQQVE